jgi:hypothetical protein
MEKISITSGCTGHGCALPVNHKFHKLYTGNQYHNL